MQRAEAKRHIQESKSDLFPEGFGLLPLTDENVDMIWDIAKDRPKRILGVKNREDLKQAFRRSIVVSSEDEKVILIFSPRNDFTFDVTGLFRTHRIFRNPLIVRDIINAVLKGSGKTLVRCSVEQNSKQLTRMVESFGGRFTKEESAYCPDGSIDEKYNVFYYGGAILNG